MSITAVYSNKPFLHDSRNVRIPLSVRFPRGRLGYLSIGPGGHTMAVMELRNECVTVVDCENSDKPVGGGEIQNLVPVLRRQAGRFFSAGAVPVILGVSHGIEWQVLPNVEAVTQEQFVHLLRCEPQRVLGNPNGALSYTGLLQESANKGIVLGVTRNELSAADEAFAKGRCVIVRRTIPMMAVLSLLLADPRVVRREAIPVVIDHGFALAIVSAETGWMEPHGRKIIGGESGQKAVAEMIERIRSFDGRSPFLIAASATNGGLPVVDFFGQAGAQFSRFIVHSVPPEQLFAYATALF